MANQTKIFYGLLVAALLVVLGGFSATPAFAQQYQQTPTPGATPQATATAGPGNQGQQGTIPQTGQVTGTPSGRQLRHPYADPNNLRYLAIYVVRGGDNLSRIANRFHTTIPELLAMNPHITDPNLIFTNQWILVHPGEQVIINPPGWEKTGLPQQSQ